MSEDAIERSRDVSEIERIDEQTRVADLSIAHPAPELSLDRLSLLSGLLLERAERSKLSLRVGDLLYGGDPEGADQLVLEVFDAHVEAQRLHLDAREVGAEARPLEAAPELALFRGVAEARHPEVEPMRAKERQEASDGMRTANRHNGNTFRIEIPTTTLSEGLDRDLIADPFNEHDRTRLRTCTERAYRGDTCSVSTGACRFDICKVQLLRLVHRPYLHCYWRSCRRTTTPRRPPPTG